MVAKSEGNPGHRMQKKSETRLRIAQEGLRLFTEHGYDVTTLDTVASAAKVSSRTFFHYFSTKNEILEFWHKQGFEDALSTALLQAPPGLGPLETIGTCLVALVPQYETEHLVAVDRIWNATPSLRAEKHHVYLRMEELVFVALRKRWPEPEKQLGLRLAAMTSIGVLRLAMEERRETESARPLVDVLKQALTTAGVRFVTAQS